MDLLEDKERNQKVIESLSEYFQSSRKQIWLVFDSVDPMGDKYTQYGMTVIFSPRDGYYSSADDKIMELIDNDLGQEMTVVSDDIEIRKKVEELNYKGYNTLNTKKASELASEIEDNKTRQENGDIDKGVNLSKDELDEINEELLKKFKRKKGDG